MSGKNKSSESVEISISSAIVLIGFVVLVAVGLLVFANLSGDTMTTDSANSNENNLQTVDVAQFAKGLGEDDVIILDIRTPQEYNSGRIAGADNIDYYSTDFEKELDALDRHQSYKLYCNSGNRSASALKLMEEMGFTDVEELRGGIQAWNNSGQSTCTSC
jgi:rhodanese-related sulfurtransferase